MVACTTKHRLTLSVTGNCMRNPELEFDIGVSHRSSLDPPIARFYGHLGKDRGRRKRAQWNGARAGRFFLKPQRLVDDEDTGRGSLNQ